MVLVFGVIAVIIPSLSLINSRLLRDLSFKSIVPLFCPWVWIKLQGHSQRNVTEYSPCELLSLGGVFVIATCPTNTCPGTQGITYDHKGRIIGNIARTCFSPAFKHKGILFVVFTWPRICFHRINLLYHSTHKGSTIDCFLFYSFKPRSHLWILMYRNWYIYDLPCFQAYSLHESFQLKKMRLSEASEASVFNVIP